MATKTPSPARKAVGRRSRASKAKKPSATLTRADLEQVVQDLACSVAPADVQALLHKKAELRQRIEALPNELALLRRQLALLLDCLRDHSAGRCDQVPLSTIALAAGALLYFSKEVDLVPDFLPRLGRLDDAAVVALAIERARKGLERYCAATGQPFEPILPPAKGRTRSTPC